MKAKKLNSIAILQEYLQMEYTRYCDEYDEEEYGTQLDLLKKKCPNYFFKNSNGYVLDSENHVMYLINKAGLPEDIRKQIVGGDASTIGDFYNQRDVYGITSDLLVYYCEDGIGTILGLSGEDLQKDNPLEEKYSSESELAKFVNGGTKGLTNQDLKKITSLVIEKQEDLILLKEFKNLINLSKVEFKNIESIEDLKGINGAENLEEVRFEKCSVNNYSGLVGTKSLKKLYLIAPVGKNQDVENLCSLSVGIGGSDFDNLQYFAITGEPYYIEKEVLNFGHNNGEYAGGIRYDITSLDCFLNLSDKTRKNIKYLYIDNLNVGSLENALNGFSGLLVLRCEYNNLKNLKGLENCKNLQYLFANAQQTDFGVDEVDSMYKIDDALASIENLTKLEFIDLSNNPIFKWIKYLNKLEKLSYLNISNCSGILDFNQIINIVNGLGENCSYPGILAGGLLAKNSTVLNLKNSEIFVEDFKKLNGSDTLYALNLSGTNIKNKDGSELDKVSYNELINEILSTCKNLNYLDISNQTKLNNISFVENMKNLYELNLVGNDNLSDLSVIEKMATGDILKLDVLMLSNVNLNLTDIQKAISVVSKNAWDRNVNKINQEGKKDFVGCSFWYSNIVNVQEADDISGVVLTNDTLLKQISNCENIVHFYSCPGWRGIFGRNFTGELDLSNCKNLISLSIEKQYYNIVLPSSLENVNMSQSTFDFKNCEKLKSIRLNYVGEMGYETFFSTWNMNCNTLEELYILEQSKLKENENDLNFLGYFKNCNNLKKLSIVQGGDWATFVLDNIDGLKYAKSLEEIDLLFGSNKSGCFADFPDLSELTNLKSIKIQYGNMNLDNIKTCKNLTDLTINNTYINNVDFLKDISSLVNVDLSNNLINDIEGLRGKTQIKSLKLGYNSVVDISPLKDLSNVTHLELNNNKLSDFAYDINGKSYYCQTVLTDLNQRNKLRELYLWGNLFDDYSIIKNESLKWTNLILDEKDKPEE